jgi:ferredoxin
MTRCTFKQGDFNCGSYAFNLYKEDIDQGDYCDRHYWQEQVQKARADEREACANIAHRWSKREDDVGGYIEATIRARGRA